MAQIYNCPKCNAKLENKASAVWAGPLGQDAFPAFVCPTDGPIAISDFPTEIREKIKKQTLISRIILFVGLIALFFYAVKVIIQIFG